MKPICIATICFIFSGVASTLLSAEPKRPGEIVLEKRTALVPDGKPIEFELGTLYVPENRSDPQSRVIGVGFARFPALEKTDVPPTFHLPGGPGSSFVAGLTRNATQLKQIEAYRRVSDVVLVDQRGFSERGDILQFKHRTPAEPLDQPGSLERSTAAFVSLARDAAQQMAAKGFDLRGYTVLECADDVDELRKALGYEQITLVGTSFGSQWSFAIMRRHPEIVTRALLSGIEPLDYGYDMPSHVFAAVQRMWWEVEQDPRFKPFLPPGGLSAAARDVLRRLEDKPVTVQVKDPATNETASVVLGREDFQRDAFARGVGPAFILAAYHEHYRPWAEAVLARRRSHDATQTLVGPLIDTSLNVSPRRKFLLRTDAGSEYLGHWNFDAYLASADVWPSPDVGDEFRTDVVSEIPVVFAQGNWDVQTPIENALYLAPYFPNGRMITAEHGGHGVIGPIFASLPEVREQLIEFLRTGKTAGLPARVTLPKPRLPAPDFPAPAATPAN